MLTDQSLASAAFYDVVPWRLDDWETKVPPEVVEVFRRIASEVDAANKALSELGKPYSVAAHLVPFSR